MLLSRSFQRKVVATCGAALGFSLLYEVTVLDSRYAAEQAEQRESTTSPAPGLRLKFSATAYCKGETTAAGTAARTGVAAADPALLPVGSVVQVEVPGMGPRYNGIYTVMDTGPSVEGRELDLYVWSCQEAQIFGRRPVRVTVLRLGWNPRASGGAAGALYEQRERKSGEPGPEPAPGPAEPPQPPAPPPSPSPSSAPGTEQSGGGLQTR
jgi:3D (Asp-Asp-Asp) domain-containing protein